MYGVQKTAVVIYRQSRVGKVGREHIFWLRTRGLGHLLADPLLSGL